MDNNSNSEIYDSVIIGTGPAGFTASIYASRYKLNTIVVGKLLGGLASESHKICNYPSEKEITGMELTNKMVEAAENQGAKIVMGEVFSVAKVGDIFVVTGTEGETWHAKTILIASGTEHRKLNIPREQELTGRGVSYCATCDAMFYKKATVAVVGGSDAALTAALYLSEIAEKVYLIYRGDELRGDPTWAEQVKMKPNVEILYSTNVIELVGDLKLESIKIDRPYNDTMELAVKGLFVEIGSEPRVKAYEAIGLTYDREGYIEVGKDQSTAVPGVWAAGDITDGSNGFRQIITAASEGAIAAESIFKHLKIGPAGLEVFP